MQALTGSGSLEQEGISRDRNVYSGQGAKDPTQRKQKVDPRMAGFSRCVCDSQSRRKKGTPDRALLLMNNLTRGQKAQVSLNTVM